jgi:hypothetical protein
MDLAYGKLQTPWTVGIIDYGEANLFLVRLLKGIHTIQDSLYLLLPG